MVDRGPVVHGGVSGPGRDAVARTLVRRVLRRGDPDPGRWAFLAAVWVHLAFVLALALIPGREPPAPPPDEVVELVVVDPPPEVVAETAPAPMPLRAAPRSGRPAPEVAEVPLPAELPEVVELPVPEPTPLPPMRVRAPNPGDPVAQLRAELGWAAIDRSQLPDRTTVLSLVGAPGAGATGGAAVSFEPAVTFRPAADLEGTALGAYVDDLERRVLDRWCTMDLDLQSRALGIQGDVTVRYRVRRSGLTADIRVVRSSGLPGLDGMAIRAIPPRVARLPASFPGEELHHEITLRYHNP